MQRWAIGYYALICTPLGLLYIQRRHTRIKVHASPMLFKSLSYSQY